MANVFDAVVAAVDKATAPMQRVMSAMRGMVGAQKAVNAESTKGTAAHARFFSVLGGHVNLLKNHFVGLRASIGQVGGSLTSLLPMLGGLGALGSVAGLFGLVEHTSSRFAELQAAATKIGAISVPQLQALQTAATMTDVPIEAMQTGLQRLDRAIGMAAGGKNKDAAALFAKLGISLKDAHGHLLTVGDALPRLADAFMHTTDPAMRMRMAFTLFGRGGAEMLPMLTAGREEMQKFIELSARLNYAPRPEEREGLEAFHRGWLGMKMAVQGLTDAVAAKLAPVLAPLIEKFRDWIAANRDWVATGIAQKVQELSGWLQRLDFNRILADVQSFAHAIGSLADVLGGPLAIAVGIATRAIWIMTTAAMANPILAAITGIALAAFLIYENWGQIKQFFTDLWAGVKQAFADAWAYIEPIITKLEAAANFVKGVAGAVGGAINSAAAAVTPSVAPGGEPTLGGGGEFSPGGLSPSPYQAPAAAGASGATGETRVKIDINGLPPGSKVQSQSQGGAAKPDLNVGYSDPMAWQF